MSPSKERRVPSRAWLGVAAITLGVGTVLTPTANAEPSTPGNPSGSGAGGQPGSTGQPKPNSTTAEDRINHEGTASTVKCAKPEEECTKPGETVGAGQDTVPAGLGNSTIVGGVAGAVAPAAPGTSPVHVGAGQDTVPAGLGNSTIVGGCLPGELRPGC